jgi:hypothetical protein
MFWNILSRRHVRSCARACNILHALAHAIFHMRRRRHDLECARAYKFWHPHAQKNFDIRTRRKYSTCARACNIRHAQAHAIFDMLTRRLDRECARASKFWHANAHTSFGMRTRRQSCMRTRIHAWTCAPAGTFRDAHAQILACARAGTIDMLPRRHARSCARGLDMACTRANFGMNTRIQILAYGHAHAQKRAITIFQKCMENF